MKNLLQSLKSGFKEALSLDLRSLALFRMAIATVIILDVSIRLTDFTPFYTEYGIMPLRLLFDQGYFSDHSFSLFTLSPGSWLPALLFGATLVCASMLLFGYKTRLSGWLLWVLVISYQNRNPFILQSGDDLLHLLLFWGNLLPWHYCFSFDSRKNDYPIPADHKHLSWAGAGYIALVFSMYFFSAWLKSSGEWRSEGTALYYALSLDQLTYPTGKWLLSLGMPVLKPLTLTVLYIELLVPLLLFIPWHNTFYRKVFIVLIVGLHLGIGITMQVGLFFVISIVGLFGLFPASWINRISPLFSKIFGTKVVSEIPEETIHSSYHSKFLTGVSAASVFLCIYFNFSTVYTMNPKVHEVLQPIGQVTGLNQNWGMFAPTVFKDDGWFILEGHDSKGRFIDFKTGGKRVNFKKPDHAVFQFDNDRWRKFGENIIFVSNSVVRPFHCDYELKRWNRKHPKNQCDSLSVVYMMEKTPEPSMPQDTITKEVICTCTTHEPEN